MSQVLGKSFESIPGSPGEKFFFYKWNFKISYFDTSMEKWYVLKKYLICVNHARVVLL